MRDVHEARLLIVDDEPELRRMLVSILRGDGYADVHEAATAAEAMEKALRLRPDALILDVMLPDGDGFSLFRDLRTFTQAPVLFLSARDEDEARLRGLGLGADDYITKPFLPREMTLRLGAVLRRSDKKLEIQPCLQGGDLLDDCRRRNEQLLRRFIEAPRIRHPEEGLQLRIIHHMRHRLSAHASGPVCLRIILLSFA